MIKVRWSYSDKKLLISLPILLGLGWVDHRGLCPLKSAGQGRVRSDKKLSILVMDWFPSGQ